jgi:hypothetical protein
MVVSLRFPLVLEEDYASLLSANYLVFDSHVIQINGLVYRCRLICVDIVQRYLSSITLLQIFKGGIIDHPLFMFIEESLILRQEVNSVPGLVILKHEEAHVDLKE